MKKLTIGCLLSSFILSIVGLIFSCKEDFPTDIVDVRVLDSIFEKALPVGLDSLKISQYVKNTHKDAGNQEHAYLLWAYYLRLADDHMLLTADINPGTTGYFKKAEELSAKINHPEVELITRVRYGHYLFTHKKMADAIPYFMRSATLLKRVNLNQVPQRVKQITQMADFFSFIGNHQQAATILSKALPYCTSGSKQEIVVYNTIGTYLKRDNNREEATVYFSKALAAAQRSKDTLQMGISLYNIGDIKFQKGEMHEAKSHLGQSIRYSQVVTDDLGTLSTMLTLAKLHIQEGEYDLARPLITRAWEYIGDKPLFLDYKLQMADLKSQVAIHDGDRTAELLQDHQLGILGEAVSQRNEVFELQQSHWRWRTEQYKDTLTLKEELRKQSRVYKQYGYLAICLFAAAGLLVIARFRHGRKKNKAILRANATKYEHEKREKEVEMQLLKGAVDEFSNSLKINNVKLEVLMEVNPKGNPVDSFESFDYLVDSHLMSDARWLKFKTLFDRVHHGYLERLKDLHPQLTEADLRIIALQKLEFSNRSIGDLLGISVDGVKKAKQRLKKKLETDKV